MYQQSNSQRVCVCSDSLREEAISESGSFVPRATVVLTRGQMSEPSMGGVDGLTYYFKAVWQV